MISKTYPSKLLLFGEYAVLVGGVGLAIPYPKYQTYWSENNTPQFELLHFYNYLKEHKKINAILNLDALHADIKKGIYLESTIPVGSGVGSSGSVVAAIYEKYALKPIQIKSSNELKLLKNMLAEMENFFHKTSSGLDPLVIYCNQPIRILSNGELEIIDTELPLLNSVQITLVDTEIERKASAIIQLFNTKLNEKNFNNLITTFYLPLVDNCIATFISGNRRAFFENIHALSAFQLEHFAFAIPESFRDQWTSGLILGNNIYKLCGAGGGGYMMSFSMHG